MTETDRLAALLPFSAECTAAGRERLRRAIRFLALAPRTPLLQPGDRVSGAYFVEHGSIRVHYLDSEGREGTLYRIEAGQSCVLALNCLFARIDYPAWAEAGEEGVSLAILDGAEAAVLMREESAFLQAVFAQVSTRLYALLQSLEQAIRLPLPARLAHALLDLADADGVVALPQERLADHVAATREAVSRILRELGSAGLLRASYGRVTIIDRDGLSERVLR